MLFLSLPFTPLNVSAIAMPSANVHFSMFCFLHKNEYVYKIAYLLLSWSQKYFKSTLHTILHKLTQNLLSIFFTPNIWKLHNHSFGELMLQVMSLTAPAGGTVTWSARALHFRSVSPSETNLQVWNCGSVSGDFPYSFINHSCSLLSSLFIYSCFILMGEFWTELFAPNVTADCCQKGRVPVLPPWSTFFNLIFCQPFLLFFKLLIIQ